MFATRMVWAVLILSLNFASIGSSYAAPNQNGVNGQLNSKGSKSAPLPLFGITILGTLGAGACMGVLRRRRKMT